MGSSSTNSSKRKPQDTTSGRTKGAERGPSGATDRERGMAAKSQKSGSGRRAPQGGKAG